MPFDAAGFRPEPPRKPAPRPGDTVATTLIIVISVTLLVLPLSIAAVADIAAAFMRAH